MDLRVASSRGTGAPLPLRTINRLNEGDTLHYRPLLRSGEERKGEVTFVLVPDNRQAAGVPLLILDPKPAKQPQQWAVPWRVAVTAFVYGPSGLSARKVRGFLSRDLDLVAQLADYAEKTSQTEALISALSSPASSSAVMQSALQGFASQYGLSVQIDRNAPPEQQAMTLFRTLNPAMASYDPISPQAGRQAGETARLATSVATLFFGSPVGLAAGGTAMLLELGSMAFPKVEFRSALSQTLPDEGLGMCGRRDAAAPRTKVAYLWASRVPNAGPPKLAVERSNSLPAGLKSPLPVSVTDADWRYVERARDWAVQAAEDGTIVPVPVQKLGEARSLELDLSRVPPGRYSLFANWDWDRFPVAGVVEVRPLPDLRQARVAPTSQDLLVGRTGKVPVTLEGADFEFVTKVEIEKAGDKFAAPAPVPFVLPQGLREGLQEHMDIQVNTGDLAPGAYRLLITQLDGRPQPVPIKLLSPPPAVRNLPVVLNQGASSADFVLRGEHLDLITRLEVGHGKASLGPASAGGVERPVHFELPSDVAAGTSLAAKAYIQDRTQPLTLSDAVRIVGPRPRIASARVSRAPEVDVELREGELPGGVFLSAILRVEHLQSNSSLMLSCQGMNSPPQRLQLGEKYGGRSLQQIAPDQLFVSFDTGGWLNGCMLEAAIANGSEGRSEPYLLGRIVRVPRVERLELAGGDPGSAVAAIAGHNLETIDKVGWSAGDPHAVTALPVPVGDNGQQRLELTMPAPADSVAFLLVWLRGEEGPRRTAIRGPAPAAGSPAADARPLEEAGPMESTPRAQNEAHRRK